MPGRRQRGDRPAVVQPDGDDRRHRRSDIDNRKHKLDGRRNHDWCNDFVDDRNERFWHHKHHHYHDRHVRHRNDRNDRNDRWDYDHGNLDNWHDRNPDNWHDHRHDRRHQHRDDDRRSLIDVG
jgi:hypothetical protein